MLSSRCEQNACPAFSLAPSRIFYTILFYNFCVLDESFSGLCPGWTGNII